MKKSFLTVTYRHGRPIAAYMQLPRQPGDRAATTERVDDILFIDRSADGRPLGVEITDPSRFDPDRLFSLLQTLGHTDVDRTDFLPLAAA